MRQLTRIFTLFNIELHEHRYKEHNFEYRYDKPAGYSMRYNRKRARLEIIVGIGIFSYVRKNAACFAILQNNEQSERRLPQKQLIRQTEYQCTPAPNGQSP